MREFHSDRIIGEKAEKEFATILSRMKNFVSVEKMDWEKYPYDLLLTRRGKDGALVQHTIEVKHLAGGYDTGCVEPWADDAKTKRPHWWHKDVDFITFKRADKNIFYVYQAQPVIEYLRAWTGPLTYAKNNNKHDSGWLVRFPWAGMPGFVTQIEGL